jgi:predicted nucleic acid-binding protein
MKVLLDTSALVALMDADDPGHEAVSGAWATILAEAAPPALTNLALAEVLAVLARRLGMDAVTVFCQGHLPLIEVHAVETPLLLTAIDTWVAARRRDLSLVDVVSFLVMRREGLARAFTTDPHFAEQGFECVPGAGAPPP